MRWRLEAPPRPGAPPQSASFVRLLADDALVGVLTLTGVEGADLLARLSVPSTPRTFAEAWAAMERQGYQYGRDALEQVRFGWELRERALGAPPRIAIDNEPCPGLGLCHGPLSWCLACGDVGRVCDVEPICDRHRNVVDLESDIWDVLDGKRSTVDQILVELDEAYGQNGRYPLDLTRDNIALAVAEMIIRADLRGEHVGASVLLGRAPLAEMNRRPR